MDARIARRIRLIRKRHVFIVRFVGQHRANQYIIQRMAGFVRRICTQNRRANHIQIATRVKDFVFDEFVGLAQPFGVEDFVFVQHNRVGQIATLRQPQAA